MCSATGYGTSWSAKASTTEEPPSKPIAGYGNE
jgi:hypothetical protein